MSDINELVGGYLAMWNETDPAARAAMAERGRFQAVLGFLDKVPSGMA